MASQNGLLWKCSALSAGIGPDLICICERAQDTILLSSLNVAKARGLDNRQRFISTSFQIAVFPPRARSYTTICSLVATISPFLLVASLLSHRNTVGRAYIFPSTGSQHPDILTISIRFRALSLCLSFFSFLHQNSVLLLCSTLTSLFLIPTQLPGPIYLET